MWHHLSLHYRLEVLHRDPNLQRCSQFIILSHSWLFGTFLLLFWHEGVYLAHWRENQSNIEFCEQFAVIVLQDRFSIQQYVHEHSQFYQLPYQLRRLLLLKFLSEIWVTWIGNCDNTSVIFNGHDGSSHGLFGIEEIFVLHFLSGSFVVHLKNI